MAPPKIKLIFVLSLDWLRKQEHRDIRAWQMEINCMYTISEEGVSEVGHPTNSLEALPNTQFGQVFKQ
jgi:hypothetical protein